MADSAGSLLHDLLSDVVPYPVFRVLSGFSSLIYGLVGTSNDNSSWTSTLLPPLATIVMAYFAFVAAYRTVRSMFSLAWFGIKWGAILGGLVAIYSWWNEGNVSGNGLAASRGIFDQLTGLGPLVNTLYSHMPDMGTGTGGSSQRRRSSPYTRRRSRYSSNVDDSQTNAGLDAFTSLFGNNNQEPRAGGGADGGVDFSAILRTVVTEGRRQGIDALSALRAAGRVQDELTRFQHNPTAWFEGVGDRFRSAPNAQANAEDLAGGYNTRSRTRARGQAHPQTGGDTQSDPWWTPSFMKREPQRQ